MLPYKTLLTLLSLTVISQVVYKYLAKKKKQKIRNEIHEVLMFPHVVKDLDGKYSQSMSKHSIHRLLYHLGQPKYNLDVCIYVLTSTDITNALLKLHWRNVKIRIIIDADMAYSSGSGIKKLSKHGVEVRWMKSTNLMHHKFCLADSLCDNSQVTPFLITGSLNWTNQGLSGNYENCLVTSKEELVQQYQCEFERLWILFKPIVDYKFNKSINGDDR